MIYNSISIYQCNFINIFCWDVRILNKDPVISKINLFTSVILLIFSFGMSTFSVGMSTF